MWKTVSRLGCRIPDVIVTVNPVGQGSLKEIILWGRPMVWQHRDKAPGKGLPFKDIFPDLVQIPTILGYAHKFAHTEKEEAVSGPQGWYTIDSPFGIARTVIGNLDMKLREVLVSLPSPGDTLVGKRSTTYVRAFEEHMPAAPGDTRYPINEVSLWDWSKTVTALFKAEMAYAVLTGTKRHKIRWRLLSIRTNGLEYVLKSPAIPDLMSRRELLGAALDRVRSLLEETYPIGLEVYRDENGSIFVVPDIAGIETNLQDSGKTLVDLIYEAFRSPPGIRSTRPAFCEVVPEIQSDARNWGRADKTGYDVPPIASHLTRDVYVNNDIACINKSWTDRHENICVSCGLRPVGPSKKSRGRDLCDTCEERRTERSEAWLDSLSKVSSTVWVDETADANGRIALVVGGFDLAHWLDGTLVSTLLARAPGEDKKKPDAETKSPSFARLHRIWETTRAFWQAVCPDSGSIEGSVVEREVARCGSRLRIVPKEPCSLGLARGHVYNIVLSSGTRISVVWDARSESFVTADNLLYLARQHDEKIKTYRDAVKYVAAKYFTGRLKVEEPAGYGSRKRVLGEFEVERVVEIGRGILFVPAIPILAEPRVFMVIVPGNKAFAVVKAIKSKYEYEMGKVQNRLPLQLGIVFAGRKTPLRALFDAGLQMLRQHSEARVWTVHDISKRHGSRGLPGGVPATGKSHYTEWAEVVLERNGERITWNVPTMMADGTTKDIWYPYVFLHNAPGASSQTYQFQSDNPWSQSDRVLVHVEGLKKGDRVWFTPSMFDFEFLDTTVRRFEIYYDREGKRASRPSRPFYLQDIDRMERIWGEMKKLSKTQRHQVVSTIEAARASWYEGYDESLKDGVFRRFVRDTLAGAAWPCKWGDMDGGVRKELVDAGVSGMLTDTLELFMKIV